MKNQRISILDGFRTLAIIPVVFFHFFTRWTQPFNDVSLYPYGSDYDYFLFGKLGVQFFFIISGFVIIYTLENTKNFGQFWLRRFIRLWPTMMVASAITFAVIYFFDYAGYFAANGQIQNFLSSITFLPPWKLETIFRGSMSFEYIDGAYWSLWFEIMFYALCSAIFFIQSKKFFRNFVLVSFLIIIAGTVFDVIVDSGQLFGKAIDANNSIFKAISYPFIAFPLHRHLAFFQLGFFFYHLFKAKQGQYAINGFFKTTFALSFITFSYYAYYHYLHSFDTMNIYIIMAVFVLMLVLFFTFIYAPKALKIFESSLMVKIGISSYFLYLIHQNIGGIVLNNLKGYEWANNILMPLALIVLLIIFSILFTYQVDKRISKGLRNLFGISRKPKAPQDFGPHTGYEKSDKAENVDTPNKKPDTPGEPSEPADPTEPVIPKPV